MAFPWEAAAIGAGANILGSGLSFLGGQSANAANLGFANQQLQAQIAQAQQQLRFNMDQAFNGISWRVADAKNAGISPLVALGAPTFNPGSVGISGGSSPNQENALAGVGHNLSAMGADVSRAAMVAQTEKVRADTIMQAETMRQNSLVAQSEAERNFADAALARKRAEIAGMPAMPSAAGIRFVDGQGNAPPADVTRLDPSKTISPSSIDRGIEAATTPAVKPVRMSDGGIDPQPSLGTSVGATGENFGWSIRNRLNPPAGWHVGWNGAWYRDEGSSWYDRPLGRVGTPDYSGVGRASQYGP